MQSKQQDFLDMLKKLRAEKDIDQIAELFMSVINMYGLTIEEVCALSYFLVDTSLTSAHNQAFIAEHFNIDTTRLSIDGKLAFVKALVATYSERVGKDGASKTAGHT